MKKLSALLLIGLTSAFMLTACGNDNGDEVETIPVANVEECVTAETETTAETEAVDEETPPEEGMVRSDLTNEWISGDIADQRPIAVMIPNDTSALPQYSISKADILYECNVEGEMTRLMAVIKDWRDLERIGNIRSCRDYFVYWAYEWDALYVHFGGPFYIDEVINKPETNNINGLNAPEGVFYRTSDRKAPQNAYINGDGVIKEAERKNYSLTYREDLYQPDHFKFAPSSTPNDLSAYGSDAIDASKIDLSPAYPVTKTWFEYNEEDGLYYRFQGEQKNDPKHIDAVDNSQLAFKNVLVQFTYHEVRDAKGYLAFQCHDDTRDGYYFTNGKGIHVTWKKESDFSPTKYYDDNGNEIELNTGKTMICIVEDGDTFEVN